MVKYVKVLLMLQKNNITNINATREAGQNSQWSSAKVAIKNGFVVNCCGQQIHEDCKMMLSENDRRNFGGARFVDAKTFIQKHPLKFIGDTFIMGTKCYEGDTINLTAVDRAACKMNVPECYEINGWKAGV